MGVVHKMSSSRYLLFFCFLFLRPLEVEASNGLISYDDLESKPVWQIEKLQSGGSKLITRRDQKPFLDATKNSKVLSRNYLSYALVVADDTDLNGYALKKGSSIGVMYFLGTKKISDLAEDFSVPCPEFCTKITLLDVLKQSANTLKVPDFQNLDFSDIKDAIGKKS